MLDKPKDKFARKKLLKMRGELKMERRVKTVEKTVNTDERKINPETELELLLEPEQESTASNLSEMMPVEVNPDELPEVKDDNQLRLESLLERMSEFETFTAEEQAIVLAHQGTYSDELAESSPEVIEELQRIQEDHQPQGDNLEEGEEDRDFTAENDSSITSSITPMAASPEHGNIISDPFNLKINDNESVCLNTGAAIFRTNILNIPGRNGFDLKLDLSYDSSRADIGLLTRSIQQHWLQDLFSPGWLFDLPYILDSTLYLPGRGYFPINILSSTFTRNLQDMRIAWDDFPRTFISGSHGSDRIVTFHDGTVYYFFRGYIIGMRDRFHNTIRFEWEGSIPLQRDTRLRRIVDTNGRHINFAYSVSGTNRIITITSPDNGVYTITLSPVTGHSGVFQLARIRNQVNSETSFEYEISRATFCTWSKRHDPRNGISIILLRRVNYPSGARLNFGYSVGYNNLGRNGSRQVWRVSTRELVDNNRANQRTTFAYDGDPTAFPQYVQNPPSNHTYGVTVTQNNGLRTVYRFNYRHLKISERTYNVNTLLSEERITYNDLKLPTNIILTEHRSGRSRTTQQSFTYNQFGQVLTETSPLGHGSTHDRYLTTNTYDNRFGLLLTTTSMHDVHATVRKANTLSADGRRITRTNAYQNNVRLSRREFFHDIHGNVTEIREFPNAGVNAFIVTQITYNNGTAPSRIQTTNVRDVDLSFPKIKNET